MRAVKSVTFNQSRKTQDQIVDLDINISRLYTLLQGRVSFGSGTDGEQGENISGEFQEFTTGSANTETTIAHTIGAIPLGYIVMHQDIAGSLYGNPTIGTDWTSTNVYLKCDTATVTFLIFLIR